MLTNDDFTKLAYNKNLRLVLLLALYLLCNDLQVIAAMSPTVIKGVATARYVGRNPNEATIESLFISITVASNQAATVFNIFVLVIIILTVFVCIYNMVIISHYTFSCNAVL